MEPDVEDDTLVGELNTSLAERRLWLLKLPTYLLNEWEAAPEKGVLGNIIIEKPRKGERRARMRMVVDGSNKEGVPKEHEMRSKEIRDEIRVFSEHVEGQLQMEGKVDASYDVNPVSNDEYVSHVGKRTRRFEEKGKSLIVLEKKAKISAERPLYTSEHFKKLKKLEERRKEKRDRMPEEKLLDHLFALFERKKEWSVRELQGYTQQPLVYLKEVVDKICVPSGVGKNMYELKPEYAPKDAEKWE